MPSLIKNVSAIRLAAIPLIIGVNFGARHVEYEDFDC